jgi:hypothetical protein
MEADHLLCSRNARPRNVLVRRAQSRIDQATLENEMKNWEDARSRDITDDLSVDGEK